MQALERVSRLSNLRGRNKTYLQKMLKEYSRAEEWSLRPAAPQGWLYLGEPGLSPSPMKVLQSWRVFCPVPVLVPISTLPLPKAAAK